MQYPLSHEVTAVCLHESVHLLLVSYKTGVRLLVTLKQRCLHNAAHGSQGVRTLGSEICWPHFLRTSVSD